MKDKLIVLFILCFCIGMLWTVSYFPYFMYYVFTYNKELTYRELLLFEISNCWKSILLAIIGYFGYIIVLLGGNKNEK